MPTPLYIRYPSSGGGVTSLNSLTGALTLAAGTGISITPSGGNTLTIAATGGGDVTLTAFGSSPNANAASLSGQALTLQPADGTHPGGVSIAAQSFAGAKTFLAQVAAPTLLINSRALIQAFGTDNTSFGANNFPNTVTGTNNLAIGDGAMQNLGGGSHNIAIGNLAANVLSGGSTNVCIGYNAGAGALTNQADNVLIGSLTGYYVHGAGNVAVGSNAMFGNTGASGADNSALGNAALTGVTTGSNNTGMGNMAGASITTGSGNTSLGANSDVQSATSSNQLSIANFIYGTGMDGSGSTISAGKIGLGVKAPAATLELQAATASQASLIIDSGTLLSSPVSGAIEYDGTNLYFTDSGPTRHTLSTSAGTVTDVSVASANGFAGSSSGGATPALTLSTTVTGILKGDGTAISAAVSGTDYQPAGDYITALTGDATAAGPGSAALTLATVNSNVGSFTNGSFTVNAKGLITAASSGTAPVTSISVASANGFAGSSSGGATPALTLSTTITGLVKGNGTAISAATAGTDYSAGTSGLATGILKSTTTTGALTIAVAGDFPTLNQNTTGTAAGLSATLAISSGGTGATSTSQNFAFIGPTSGSGAPSFRALVAGDIPSLTGAYASTTLNNLGTTAINANLLPASDAGSTLGDSTHNWSTLGAYAVNASNGTKAIELNSSTGRALNSGSTRNVSWGLSSSATAPGVKFDQATTNGFVKTSGGDGTLAIDATVYASGTRTINTQSGTTYTAVLADGSGAGGSPIVYFTSGSATTFTIPTNASVAFPVGTQIDISQQGAGKVTVAAAGGVTIHSKGGNLSLNGQYVGATLIKDATNTWCLYGDLTA